MKIYFAGDGHDVERTPFADKYNWNFLLTYGGDPTNIDFCG